jgi:hypothetical protein
METEVKNEAKTKASRILPMPFSLFRFEKKYRNSGKAITRTRKMIISISPRGKDEENFNNWSVKGVFK